jgi:hypothetical protein
VQSENRSGWGVAADPAKQVRETSQGLYFIGGMFVVVGWIAAFFTIPELSRMGFGYVSALYGAAFLILGYFVSRQSVAALGVAWPLWLSTLSPWSPLLPRRQAVPRSEG